VLSKVSTGEKFRLQEFRGGARCFGREILKADSEVKELLRYFAVFGTNRFLGQTSRIP
jgi:hypothetical protein